MKCTYTVTWWRFRVTTVAVETHILHSVCVFELHGTVNSTKILSVAQQCFYGIFVSPLTIKRM